MFGAITKRHSTIEGLKGVLNNSHQVISILNEVAPGSKEDDCNDNF